ncbi:hypothetical protein CI102_166 [Trichoderma harzianum]|uniref:Copper acquisition factor BIM1-like domain-containing protein n=1 Tax=Trichoderma harzianum CBS 226.95 TaxID=983964 RepID=A0A2T4ALW8_TRIHA|nr:hypothetical protein M431DRAFT_517481 [Trichoderma harzianum CBS 226.95]PKK55127.1 hypothetical protein CI102_166 [Trichoderma harzianum]PTB57858.1 hypothetical protein M431DRAFT_517481 [Trichoderma harzianum CBS 226.95]
MALSGAASFGWPPPRVWEDAYENIAPCGSVEDPGSRTNFTLHQGHVLIFTQAKAWNVKLGVSYTSHPNTLADFQPMMKYVWMDEVDAGVTCINVPDAPMAVKAGTKATLQLSYRSPHEVSSDNITLYTCADITYVHPADVPYQTPCFNTTLPKDHFVTLPPGPRFSPLKFPIAENVTITPDTTGHEFPKWAIPLAGVAGAFVATLFVFLVFKCCIIPRRHRQLMEIIKRRTNYRI